MDVTTIKLPTDLTIAQVTEFKSDCLDIIAQASTITLDDSDVVKIDTIGVQFILAIIRLCVSQKKELIWQAQSQIVQDSISRLGMETTEIITSIAA